MRVYLDSMVWIYFLDGNPVFGPDSTALISRLRADGHRLLSSFLVEGELLVLPKRNGDRFTEASYKRFFSSAGVVSVPYPPLSSDMYAELRARHRTKPADTLHAILAATVPGIGQITRIAQAINLL